MSKKSKTKSKEVRQRAKRAAKASKAANYQAMAGRGSNQKTAARNRKKAQSVSLNLHPLGPCGNLGCNKCHPVNFNPFLVDGKPKGMRQRMYLKWLVLT